MSSDLSSVSDRALLILERLIACGRAVRLAENWEGWLLLESRDDLSELVESGVVLKVRRVNGSPSFDLPWLSEYSAAVDAKAALEHELDVREALEHPGTRSRRSDLAGA